MKIIFGDFSFKNKSNQLVLFFLRTLDCLESLLSFIPTLYLTPFLPPYSQYKNKVRARRGFNSFQVRGHPITAAAWREASLFPIGHLEVIYAPIQNDNVLLYRHPDLRVLFRWKKSVRQN